MSGFFSTPKPPPVIMAPPPPTPTDPSVEAAADAQRQAQAQAAGRASTILTSGLGDTSTPTLGKKELLGQA
jgi:hypothetical protein